MSPGVLLRKSRYCSAAKLKLYPRKLLVRNPVLTVWEDVAPVYVLAKARRKPSELSALTLATVRQPHRPGDGRGLVLRPLAQDDRRIGRVRTHQVDRPRHCLMTGTTVEIRDETGTFEMLPNLALSGLMHAQLTRIGAAAFDGEDHRFAHRSFARRSDWAPTPTPTAGCWPAKWQSVDIPIPLQSLLSMV